MQNSSTPTRQAEWCAELGKRNYVDIVLLKKLKITKNSSPDRDLIDDATTTYGYYLNKITELESFGWINT